MNFHSDEWIMNRVMEHYKEAKTIIPEEQIIGIFYQGSGNYGLDTEASDVDTKLIVVPSLRDVALNHSAISTTHIRDNGEHIDIKDVRLILQNFKKQNINSLEILFTPYKYFGLSRYYQFWKNLEKPNEEIARYNPTRFIQTILGMSRSTFQELEHRTPANAQLINKYGYNSKKLCHLIRFNEVLRNYLDGKSFKECLLMSPDIADYLQSIKNYKLSSLDIALNIGKIMLISTKIIGEEALKNDYPKNEEIEKFIDNTQYEIVKKALCWEMEKND